MNQQPAALERWPELAKVLGRRGWTAAEITDWLWLAKTLAAELPKTQPARGTPSEAAPGSGENQPTIPDRAGFDIDADPQGAASSGSTPPPPTPSPSAPPAPEEALLAPLTAENSGNGAAPRVGIADSALLRRPRQLGRALAPLNRWNEEGPACVLDVAATVDAIASARSNRMPWQPCLKPRRQPWLELQLVFDASPSMALWQRLRRELPRLLAREARWRDLRCWQLLSDPNGRVLLADLRGRPCAPRRLRQRTDRSLVLVVSDAVAPAWYQGAMAEILQGWATVQPVALLQLFPQRLWLRTALVEQPAGWISSATPMRPHGQLVWQPVEGGAPLPAKAGVAPWLTLPVLQLQPEFLAAWARLLAGSRRGSALAYRFALPAPVFASGVGASAAADADPGSRQPSATAETEAASTEDLLAMFLFTASARARKLLALLTFAPVITLPIVRLLHGQMLEPLGAEAVAEQAEVLFSGLFAPATAQPARPIPVDQQRLRFVAESLRPRLREGLRIWEAQAVYQRVQEFVIQSLNLSQAQFDALLLTPEQCESHPDRDLLRAFATAAPSCLRGLGGRYEVLAEQLEQRWKPEPPPMPPPSQSWLQGLEEREEDFDVAQLVALPPLQPILVTAAWLMQEKLQRISFHTARLAGQLSPGRVVASSREPQLVMVEPSTAAAVTALIGLPDGRFAAASADATIRIWDPASGSSSAVLRGHRDGVFALALLPNGWLASGSSDRTIRLWDLASGSCLAEFEGHQGGVHALAVLPDGRLASGSTDSTIRILDPATGHWARVFEGHRSGVHALAVLPDGRLASGAGDWSVRLWDPAGGNCLAVFEGHQRRVNALAVLPDGRLASGSDDHTIRLWDTSSESCLAVYQGHQAEIRALVMVAAGLLASGARDGAIRLWDLASGDCVKILEGNGGEEEILAGNAGSVESLLLLADGRLVSSANDRRIRIWGTRSELLADIASKPEPVAHISLQEASAWGFHEPLQRDHLPFGATAERPDPLALTLVEIAAGSFLMGSPPNEPERSEHEGPQHEVTLTSFFISQTPITQAQWRAVAQWQPLPAECWGRQLDPEPSFFQPRSNPKARAFSGSRFSLLKGEIDSEQRPVDNVSWLDAIEFCSRLSQRTGRTYTLPSEAQWEYACRAGTTTAFHFGATITPELANYVGTSTYADGSKGEVRKQTTPVGMFPANAWGLQDMHGNVWEWCLDHWHDSYEGAPADGSAWENLAEPNNKATTKKGNNGDSKPQPRLLRGGSWFNLPAVCRSAYRINNLPVNRSHDVGFRVCCLPQD